MQTDTTEVFHKTNNISISYKERCEHIHISINISVSYQLISLYTSIAHLDDKNAAAGDT